MRRVCVPVLGTGACVVKGLGATVLPRGGATVGAPVYGVGATVGTPVYGMGATVVLVCGACVDWTGQWTSVQHRSAGSGTW
jgi:hypothetical protein